jgi:hypothetical protein
MMLAAVAVCSVGLLASGADRATGGGATEVFRMTSPDGDSITVKRSERVEHVAPTKEHLAGLPKDAVAFEGDVAVYDYVAYVGKGPADERVIWTKTYYPSSLPGTTFNEIVVHDILLHGGQAAILYSTISVNVDMMERRADGQYSLLWTEKLFRQSDGMNAMAAGRLVWARWLSGLYALVETAIREEEIWLVERGNSQRVYKRTDVIPSR